jgi:hypothetical protein
MFWVFKIIVRKYYKVMEIWEWGGFILDILEK